VWGGGGARHALPGEGNASETEQKGGCMAATIGLKQRRGSVRGGGGLGAAWCHGVGGGGAVRPVTSHP
jgi:hypothetical protein